MNRLWTPFLALVLLVLAVESSACGSVAFSFHRMKLETDKDRLETFLQSHSCPDDLKFSPDRADPQVAVVLINAARARVAKDVFESVLSRFNCVAQLRTRGEYQLLIDYIGQDKFAKICSPERLDRVYVVKAQRGANLRASPSMDGGIVGAVERGSVAIDGEPNGDWVKLKTYAGEGYMHQSTLRPYVDTIDPS